MNVPTKLGVFAAALLIVFAAAYAIAAGVAPDRASTSPLSKASGAEDSVIWPVRRSADK